MNPKIIFLVLSFVVLTSCGEEFKAGTNLDRDLNKLKSLETDDELSNKEKSLMKSFCAELDRKVVFYNSNYVGESISVPAVVDNNGNIIEAAKIVAKTIDMTTVNSDCGEVATFSDEDASIKIVNGRLYFSSGVPFPEVVSRESEELSDMCAKSNSDGSVPRYVVDGEEAKWFEVMENTDLECGTDAMDENTICLKISTGVRSSIEDDFKIVKIDFLKTTKTNSSYRGVIYSRNLVDSQICDGNEFSIKSQQIKDLP